MGFGTTWGRTAAVRLCQLVFIPSFSTCYTPGGVPGTGATAVNKQNKTTTANRQNACLQGANILMGDIDKTENMQYGQRVISDMEKKYPE